MGYSGLNCVEDSDYAADLAYTVFKKMAVTLRKGLQQDGNMFNTNGCVNVALFIEQHLKPKSCYNNDEVIGLVRETKIAMEAHIAKSIKCVWDSESNKEWHLKAYKRMLKNLNKFLERENVAERA